MDSPTNAESPAPKEKPVVITSSGNRKGLFRFSFVNPKFLGAMTVLLLMVGGIGTSVYLVQTRQQTTSQASLTPVDLSFKPSQITVSAGSEFNLDVFVNAEDNQLTGTDLTIKYDPKRITLKSVNPKQFLPRILVQPTLASGSATVSLGADGNSGVSGSGIIAGLIFSANPTETADLTEVHFDSSVTKIKILNRTAQTVSDNFGATQITINPKGLISNTPPASHSASPSQSIFDFNNDGQVNSVDLSLMYSGWGSPETEVQKKADVNRDGVINGIDYSTLLPRLRR